MTICEYCVDQLFTEPYWSPTEKDHHTNIATWKESIQRCTICSCLLDAIKNAIMKAMETKYSTIVDSYTRFDPILSGGILGVLQDILPIYRVELLESVARGQFTLILRPVEKNVDRLEFSTPFGLIKGLVLPVRKFQVYSIEYDNDKRSLKDILKDSPRLSNETSIDVKTNSKNQRTLNQIKRWLEHCDSKHELCKHVSNVDEETHGFVPTRLIVVGKEGDDTVRLVETSGDPFFKRYATLSHCWGGKIAVITTEDNYAKHRQSIALNDDFPLNFKHAIYVCRALGIAYIWIDSLCIIQEPKEDWHREAPKMHQVYGSSYLNIAVAGSWNSTEGLFRHRRINLLEPSIVKAGWGGREKYYKVVRGDFWDGELLEEPLYRRAWVTQERMLSPRTLNFGSKQMFWQCLTIAACETMPDGIPEVVNSSGQEELQWRRLLARTKSRNGGAFGNDDKTRLQEVWRDVVKNYTSCNMTSTTDKLPALAGLAQVMYDICGEEYVAGMWHDESVLVGQLAWKVKDCRNADGRPSRRQRTDEYRAPTWAWPSVVDGMIEIPRRVWLDEGYQLEVLEKPTLEYKKEGDQAIFMELENGYLKAQGTILELDFVHAKDTETSCWAWDVELEDDQRPWCYLYPDEPFKPNRFDPANVQKERLTTPVLLLDYSQTPNGGYSGHGLALNQQIGLQQSATESKELIFNRVGLVEFKELREDIFEAMMSCSTPMGVSAKVDVKLV